MTTRREIIKAGAGLMAILAAGKAPAYLVRSMLGARGSLMAGRRLPYDAEVEYIESTGTQWIDTGVVPASTSRMVADIKFEGSANMVSGVWASSGRFQFGIVSGVFTLGIGSIGQNGIAADTLRHTFILDAGTKTANIDGNQYSLTSASIRFAQYTIPIFAQRYASNTPSNYCRAKLYGYKLFNNGVLVRDFIPVRVGTTGALYDKRGVGGMNPDGTARNDGMYFNRGTGNFGYGNDK